MALRAIWEKLLEVYFDNDLKIIKMDPMVFFPKFPRKKHHSCYSWLNACTHLKFQKQWQIRPDLHLKAVRFQNSGQYGFYRPGSYGNFTLECYQPCDLHNNRLTLKYRTSRTTLNPVYTQFPSQMSFTLNVKTSVKRQARTTNGWHATRQLDWDTPVKWSLLSMF